MPKVAKALTDRAVKNLKYPEPGGDKGPVAFAVGEVRGATWNEIDLKAGLWIIPAARMKMDREYRVPMPAAATALLKALPRFENNALVFPAQGGGQMSDMTLSATMKRINATDKQGFVDRVSKRPAVPPTAGRYGGETPCNDGRVVRPFARPEP